MIIKNKENIGEIQENIGADLLRKELLLVFVKEEDKKLYNHPDGIFHMITFSSFSDDKEFERNITQYLDYKDKSDVAFGVFIDGIRNFDVDK